MDLIYSKEQIEELLNLVNTFPFTGFQNAEKLLKVYNILNSPKKDIKETVKE